MKNTIFDYVNAILHNKNTEVFSSVDDESTFNAFMLNRWISMYSPEMANLVNQTTNKYATLFDSKQEQFKFFVSVYPCLKQKRIHYIKKPSTKAKTPEKEKEVDTTLLIARNMECSQREIKMYNELVDIIKNKT